MVTYSVDVIKVERAWDIFTLESRILISVPKKLHRLNPELAMIAWRPTTRLIPFVSLASWLLGGRGSTSDRLESLSSPRGEGWDCWNSIPTSF